MGRQYYGVRTSSANHVVKANMTSFVRRALFRRDHRWAPDRLSSYLDRELGKAKARRMERHLRVCTECRRLLSGLRITVEALRRLPAPGDDVDVPALAASVRGRLQPRPPS
jgi:anti-sigma factor RsiW